MYCIGGVTAAFLVILVLYTVILILFLDILFPILHPMILSKVDVVLLLSIFSNYESCRPVLPFSARAGLSRGGSPPRYLYTPRIDTLQMTNGRAMINESLET